MDSGWLPPHCHGLEEQEEIKAMCLIGLNSAKFHCINRQFSARKWKWSDRARDQAKKIAYLDLQDTGNYTKKEKKK